MNKEKWVKILTAPRTRKVLALILLIILSVYVVCPIATNPKAQKRTINTLDRSKEKAVFLSLTVTVASTALSMLPEDTASPLADELSDLSAPLMLIVCVLYLEQFLLVALNYLSFRVLIPFSLGISIVNLFGGKKKWKVLAKKLFLLALVCIFLIPMSAGVTRLIESAFADSINSVDEKIREISNAFNKVIGGNEKDFFKIIGTIADGVASIFEFFKESLSLLIDGVAILIITSCVIPAISAILFVWAIKSILNKKLEGLEETLIDVNSFVLNTNKRIKNKMAKNQGNKDLPVS